MMIVSVVGGKAALVNSVRCGDHKGTVAFCIDMWLWKAGTVGQVKGKDILLLFILPATY